MLTLYYKPTCPYCRDVLAEAESLQVTLRLKDIVADPFAADELVARGGRRRVPFLYDEEGGSGIYESEAIIAFLHGRQAAEGPKQTFGGLRIHRGDETCDACQ